MSTTVRIENLSKNVLAPHLREIFGAYGEITSLELTVSPHLQAHDGTAHITYSEEEGAKKAIACMHGGQLDGAKLSVDLDSK